MSRALIGALLTASACTSIPEPSEREPVPPDAATGVGGSGGGTSCLALGDWGGLGNVPVYFQDDDSGPGVLNYTIYTIAADHGETLRLEIYVAGLPDELRGRVQALGEDDLASCVHCLVVRRACEATGMSCDATPYFPRSGRSVVSQMAAALGDALYLQMTDVELVPVSIDDALHVTPAASGECLHFNLLLQGGSTEASPFGCMLGYQCPIAATASARHPH